MKDDNIIQQKSYQFAMQIVISYRWLCEEKKEFVLSKQLVRCATSIGANVEEAIGGQSDKDFLSKLSIAYKEAREANYWLRLLTDTDYLPMEKSQPLMIASEEIQKILGSIIKTVKSKQSQKIPNS